MKFTFLALLKFVLYEWTAILKIYYRVKSASQNMGFFKNLCVICLNTLIQK